VGQFELKNSVNKVPNVTRYRTGRRSCSRPGTTGRREKWILPPGLALASALQDADAIAAGLPLALAAIKAMLAQWPADPREILEREVDWQATLMDTDDFAVFRGR
jgi:hypothetical protein